MLVEHCPEDGVEVVGGGIRFRCQKAGKVSPERVSVNGANVTRLNEHRLLWWHLHVEMAHHTEMIRFEFIGHSCRLKQAVTWAVQNTVQNVTSIVSGLFYCLIQAENVKQCQKLFLIILRTVPVKV